MTDSPIEPSAWFEVDFDDSEHAESESDLFGTPAAFLRKVRELVPNLRTAGLTDRDTFAWYEDDRLGVLVDIRDTSGRMAIGALRLEISDSDWIAAWVTPGRSDQDDFEAAEPVEQTGNSFTDPQEGIAEAVAWLETQASRPIARYIWRTNDETVVRAWRLEDSGRFLAASGPASVVNNLEAADERVQVHP